MVTYLPVFHCVFSNVSLVTMDTLLNILYTAKIEKPYKLIVHLLYTVVALMYLQQNASEGVYSHKEIYLIRVQNKILATINF